MLYWVVLLVCCMRCWSYFLLSIVIEYCWVLRDLNIFVNYWTIVNHSNPIWRVWQILNWALDSKFSCLRDRGLTKKIWAKVWMSKTHTVQTSTSNWRCLEIMYIIGNCSGLSIQPLSFSRIAKVLWLKSDCLCYCHLLVSSAANMSSLMWSIDKALAAWPRPLLLQYVKIKNVGLLLTENSNLSHNYHTL